MVNFNLRKEENYTTADVLSPHVDCRCQHENAPSKVEVPKLLALFQNVLMVFQSLYFECTFVFERIVLYRET